MKGDFSDVSWWEALGAFIMSASVGIVHALYMLRRGRKFKWFDLLLEPLLAVLAGMSMWAIGEVTSIPDLMQSVFMCLGAWGGPRTIHALEVKYMGGSRKSDPDTGPAPLGDQ